jgi:predicted secreted protein
MKTVAVLGVACLVASSALAQTAIPADRVPSVTVNASATATLPNDRMSAWLRTESENASAAVAAADVNTRMARALAKLKAQPAIKVASSGYSTNAIVEKGKPTRWRVSQAITLDSADFAVLATEVGKLQDDGMLLSGLGFSLSDAARKTAEDSVTQQAIKSWQERAQNAAQALGYTAWRVGTVHVQTNDGPRPYMAMRSEMKTMAAAPAPVAADAGTTDVTVNVSGDALLSSPH